MLNYIRSYAFSFESIEIFKIELPLSSYEKTSKLQGLFCQYKGTRTFNIVFSLSENFIIINFTVQRIVSMLNYARLYASSFKRYLKLNYHYQATKKGLLRIIL